MGLGEYKGAIMVPTMWLWVGGWLLGKQAQLLSPEELEKTAYGFSSSTSVRSFNGMFWNRRLRIW